MFMINMHCFSFFLSLVITFYSTVYSHEYHSQVGQDSYLNEHFFKNRRGGYFFDIGAHDGVTISNTYFFEKELGWSGICFEPLPCIFPKLEKQRNCHCVNGCIAREAGTVDFIEVFGYSEMLSGIVSTYDSRHMERLKREISQLGGSYQVIKMRAYKFDDIIMQYKIDRIDYLSIDTEGGELDILKSIDFGLVDIYMISVENNYNDPSIRKFMETKKFELVTMLEQDEIYINKSMSK